jgi:hypothetical protein
MKISSTIAFCQASLLKEGGVGHKYTAHGEMENCDFAGQENGKCSGLKGGLLVMISESLREFDERRAPGSRDLVSGGRNAKCS